MKVDMPTNRLAIVLMSIMLCAVMQFSSLAAYAQQSAAAPDQTSTGVELYTQGDMAGAIRVLRVVVLKREEDSRAWHYLGLALIRQGNLREAREALDKAVKLRRESFFEEYDRAGDEIRDDQLARLKSLLNDAIESEKRFLEITDAEEQSYGIVQTFLEGSQVLAYCTEQATKVDAGHRVFRKSDIKTQKSRVLKKPFPSSTDEARRERANGTVVLKAVFAADGTVKYIRVANSLKYGLTEQAIKAAKKIKFEPATMCGRPVPQFIQLEYNFSTF